jgi:hypothetical protein
MAELQNTLTTNKSYLTTVSYKTSMSLIKNIQQIALAVYMVTDCVEESEPMRYEARAAILNAMKSVANVVGSVQVSSANFRNAHANLILTREHISILEIMGYVSSMNANILVAEIDKAIAKLDTSILDTDSPHEAKVGLRNDMSFGIDLGQLFYKKLEIQGDSDKIDDMTGPESSEITQKPLGKIEKEMGRLQRKSLILKLFREIPSNLGEKELTMNELVDKYSRYGGEGQISEKTLSRELADLIADGTLTKIGSKRWVKYRLLRN